MVVESCFEVILRHADVVTCSSGCCHFGLVDDVICETFSIKRAKFPASAITCLSVVGRFRSHVVVFDYVGHVSCAAVAYFKVVSFEDLVQFV